MIWLAVRWADRMLARYWAEHVVGFWVTVLLIAWAAEWRRTRHARKALAWN